jgi:hypothetical protein
MKEEEKMRLDLNNSADAPWCILKKRHFCSRALGLEIEKIFSFSSLLVEKGAKGIRDVISLLLQCYWAPNIYHT